MARRAGVSTPSTVGARRSGRPRTRIAWHSCGVASNVVNLNRFRKKKAREEKAKQADTNRIRHGRTQAEKDRERTERERAARLLEGKRLDGEADRAASPVNEPEQK